MSPNRGTTLWGEKMNIFLTISLEDGDLLTILFAKAFGNEE